MPKEPIHTSRAPAAIGPYSQAIRAGSTIYLSGQIPLDPKTKELVKGDIRVQTRQVFENLAAVWLELKQPGKAGDLCAKAVMINTTALGTDHPRTLESRALLEKINVKIEKKKNQP